MTPVESAYSRSRIEQWADRLDHVPRRNRIILTLVIVLELTLLVSVVVDRLLIEAVYDGEVGAMVPALVAAGVGVALYVIGWWSLVGFDGDPAEPWRAGAASVLFVALGAAGLIVLAMLALVGLAQGYIL